MLRARLNVGVLPTRKDREKMTVRVEVAPAMLAWAGERSGRDRDDLERRFPKLPNWELGELSPTLKQLEHFAHATYTPIGYFFLDDPPLDRLTVPDFRTIGSATVATPSPNLLDTIALCEQRQEWYRDFARSSGEEPIGFVGSLTIATSVEEAAQRLRAMLDFGTDMRRQLSTWTASLQRLSENAEEAGVLVMISGVVGSNTRRKLDPQEFRGFALVDEFAPLVFINGSDTKAAQIFTLAHELVHIWLGQSAVSNPMLAGAERNDIERWCNQVAAELLVPLTSLRQEFTPGADLLEELRRLARRFKVSTLVVLKRIHDGGYLSWEDFHSSYVDELDRLLDVSGASGGNFYNTQPVRVSKRFARAIIESTLEGHTLHRDAFRLLGFKKFSTFEEIARKLGVA